MALIGGFTSLLSENLSEHGWRGMGVTAIDAFNWLKSVVVNPVRHRIAARNAENVYEREWDVLIVLDCARVDLLRAVEPEYDFIESVGELVSVGSTSPEWMKHTFTGEYDGEMAETVYVTGNTSTDEYISDNSMGHLEEVWRDGWDTEIGTVHPETVTDGAIALHRNRKPDRMIVHYMQPHGPYLPFDSETNSQKPLGSGMSLDQLVEKKGYTTEEIWEIYLENLRVVLDQVAVLLENIDAERVVISADHGEAFGEGGKWGHYWGSRLDSLRKVPWAVTTATDEGGYAPETTDSHEGTEDLSVEDKLSHLGYC
jgi:hypothetical protein